MPVNPDLEKKTLFLRRGDWDFLTDIFHPQGLPTSAVVRTLVSNWVDQKQAEMPQPKLDVDPKL